MLMIVVSEITYTVSSGMLNSTIPYFVCSIVYLWVYLWVYFNFFAVCCFDFSFCRNCYWFCCLVLCCLFAVFIFRVQ